MALLLVAQNGVLFLFGWEGMALSAFFLVTTEDHKSEARQAGWVYLVATHASTLCLFALIALFSTASGSLDLLPLRADSTSPRMSLALFALALVGFGIKAGIVPLHVWLPGAHAAAPSHVSALMSGVIIKMGIYGILRFTSLLPHQTPEWGAVVLGLGQSRRGWGGVRNPPARRQRLLAYHSIENIGLS